VRGARRDPGVVEDPEGPVLPEEVSHPIPALVASRDQDGGGAELGDAAGRLREIRLALRRAHPRQVGGLGAVRSDDGAEGEDFLPEGAEARAGQQGGTRGRGEHRVEHDVPRAMAPQSGRDRADSRLVVEHADLDRGRDEVRENGVDLARHEPGRERLDRPDAARVLRGPGDDHGRRPDAVGRQGPDVRLDPCATARLGSGDRDDRRPKSLPAASGRHRDTLANGADDGPEC